MFIKFFLESKWAFEFTILPVLIHFIYIYIYFILDSFYLKLLKIVFLKQMRKESFEAMKESF